MSVSVETSPVLDALARLEAAEDELAGLWWERCSDADLVEVLRRREVSRRKAAVLDQRLIEQVDRRSIWFTKGCASMLVFLRMLLRITPGEAKARSVAAKLLGPQRNVQGEPVAAIYPAVCAAQQAGDISAQHAAVVLDTLTKLPVEVAAKFDTIIETALVEAAREHDPQQLRRQADQLRYFFDPDGQYNEARHRERLRDVRLRDNPDGSARLLGELTAECAERLRVVFDSLAKPRPAEDGTPDPRTPGQRRHDALLEWLRLVERAGTLPKTGGVAATVLLIMDLDAYGTGDGTARTGHGFTIPADIAKRWAEPEARIVLTLLSDTKGIEAYSTAQRFFTEQQRLAMAARDRGCSFPNCDACAAWADAHHVTDWKDTHRTSVDDGTLVCGRNHDTFTKMGYTSVMINGRPHWIPPKWIDPAQKPQRNTMHDR